MYIKPMHWSIALVVSMIFGLLIGLFAYEQSDGKNSGKSEESVVAAGSTEKTYPECDFIDVKSKLDKLCSYVITYREYDAIASDPNEKYTLYGVKEGQNARAAISKDDWKDVGHSKIPVCRIIADTKHVPWCWDEKTLQPVLVAYHSDGRIVTIAANNYFDVYEGYKVVSILREGKSNE